MSRPAPTAVGTASAPPPTAASGVTPQGRRTRAAGAGRALAGEPAARHAGPSAGGGDTAPNLPLAGAAPSVVAMPSAGATPSAGAAVSSERPRVTAAGPGDGHTGAPAGVGAGTAGASAGSSPPPAVFGLMAAALAAAAVAWCLLVCLPAVQRSVLLVSLIERPG